MAKQEKLKGEISVGGQYMWVSSGGCDECNGRDGTIYNSPEDIPDRPHPNCRCYIEFIENDEQETDAEVKNANQNVEADKDNIKNDIQSNNIIENIVNKIDNKIDDVEIKYKKATQEQDRIDELNGDLRSLKEEAEAIEQQVNKIEIPNNNLELTVSASVLKEEVRSLIQKIKIIADPTVFAVVQIRRGVDKLSEELEKLLKEVKQYGINMIVKAVKGNERLKNIIKDNTPVKALKIPLTWLYYSDIYNTIKKAYGPDVAGILDIAHIKSQNPDYLKNTTSLDNYNDNRIKKYSSYLKGKIEQQFKSYENIDPKNVNGYYFHSNSELSQRMAKSKEFKEAIKNKKLNHRDKHGKLDSIGFDESNFYYSFHNADIIDRYYDKDGKLHIVISDTNEYNEGENNLVKAGRQAMQEGYLKPLYFIVDVEVEDE